MIKGRNLMKRIALLLAGIIVSSAIFVGCNANAQNNVQSGTPPPVVKTDKDANLPTDPIQNSSDVPDESETTTEAETQESTQKTTEKVTDENTNDFEIIEETEPNTANEEKQKLYQKQWDEGYLIAIDNPDPLYSTSQIILSEEDKVEACRIVYGESGNQGYYGMCLIAQCLKDAMCFDGYASISDVRKGVGYDGYSMTYSQEAVDAVNFIFDQNGQAVQHRILYMYAPAVCNSAWHETQCYVLDYLDVRFFDRWW